MAEKDPLKILEAFARFPSVSTDPAFAEGMQGAREYAAGCLEALGFKVETIDTPMHPILLGERRGSEDAPTILIYGHYDVQPADPIEAWTSPPFEPTQRDGRLYARGAADNKGPLAVQFAALARLFEEQPDCPLNLLFLIEGEEETGSPSIPGFLEEHGERLRAADFVLLSDTGIPDHEQLVITTGLRGLAILEVELRGPKVDLHSGVHGGAVVNPIAALAKLCASLHDEEGRVAIDGFYDGVIEPQTWEREQLERLPLDRIDYAKYLDVDSFAAPPDYSPFEAIRFLPTLEFNGIGGGYQGAGSKTVIPSTAFAKITCRLVPGQDPEQVTKLVEKALLDRAPRGVKVKVTLGEGGTPYRVVPPGRPDTPDYQPETLRKGFEAAHEAVTEVFGKPPLYLREGGSVPIIGLIHAAIGLDSLMLGLFCAEDNLHAPDESFSIRLMEDAVDTYVGLLRRMAAG